MRKNGHTKDRLLKIKLLDALIWFGYQGFREFRVLLKLKAEEVHMCLCTGKPQCLPT